MCVGSEYTKYSRFIRFRLSTMSYQHSMPIFGLSHVCFVFAPNAKIDMSRIPKMPDTEMTFNEHNIPNGIWGKNAKNAIKLGSPQ